jgi:hypothetical protein
MQQCELDRARAATNESPSSLGERSNARKTIRVAWGKVLEWVTKASLLSFRESFGSSAPPILAKLRERGCDLPQGEGGPGFECPSDFGVLACTHLLHRGPSPASVKKKKKTKGLGPLGPSVLYRSCIAGFRVRARAHADPMATSPSCRGVTPDKRHYLATRRHSGCRQSKYYDIFRTGLVRTQKSHHEIRLSIVAAYQADELLGVAS